MEEGTRARQVSEIRREQQTTNHDKDESAEGIEIA